MDVNNLENAINSAKKTSNTKKETSQSQMSLEQEIGFHKGSLNTLIAERTELLKIVGNIEGIIQAHIKRLEDLGVSIK